ncbi:MAG: Na+/H+ antiporter subunit E [Betaproteobacteria bacterium]
MKRLLPAPLLSLVLFALWLALNHSTSAGHLALAAIIGLAVPVLTAPLRPLPVRVRHPVTIVRLVVAVAHDVIVSNWRVGARIVHKGGRGPPQPAFVRVPLALRDASGLAALAIITTIIPGTVWSELALDRSVLLLHVFDLDDEAAFVAHYKDRYERPLLEVFG